MNDDLLNISEYRNWLRTLKQQIKSSQIKAALSVNSQMIMLYWDLGKQIAEKQEYARWGSGFIEQLSKDLQTEFPEMTGFSVTNLQYCKRFFKLYAQFPPPSIERFEILPQVEAEFQNADNETDIILPQLGGKLEESNLEQLVPKLISIPWGHQKLIVDRCKTVEQAVFYTNKIIENNWSRAVLEYHIESNLYASEGKAVTNFALTLPEVQSDLANALLKDPYNFDFLQLSQKVRETDLETALVQHISQFLLALGNGFAYMGRQFPLKVGKKDYRTDLLFYHTRLKCYVIIELKIKEFEPEFAGKLNFYISAINEFVRQTDDRPTIGILLCREKDDYEVEFALRDINNPIGVSTFHYTELSDDIKAALPSAETLQNELRNFEREFEGKN